MNILNQTIGHLILAVGIAVIIGLLCIVAEASLRSMAEDIERVRRKRDELADYARREKERLK